MPAPVFVFVSVKKGVDFISWIHYSSDGNIVVEGINNHCQKLAHVGLNKIWFFIKFRREIS